jgi:hypothetical protein
MPDYLVCSQNCVWNYLIIPVEYLPRARSRSHTRANGVGSFQETA